MAQYPPRGLAPWDEELKAYIDDSTAGSSTDAGVAHQIENGTQTDAALAGAVTAGGEFETALTAAIGDQVDPVAAQAETAVQPDDPFSISIIDALTRRPSITDFVHYGDSMTDRAWSGDWVSTLADLTAFDHYEAGAPGETAQQIHDRWMADTTRRTRRFTLEMGRNDVTNATPSVDDFLTLVQQSFDHFVYQRQGMVLQVPPWSGEGTTATGSGLTARNRRLAMDAALAEAFPLHYEAIYDWLRTTEAATAAGITFTSNDTTIDIPQQLTPRSFRRPNAGGAGIDGGHLNAYGGAAFYYRVAQRLYERGLINTPPVAVTINHADTFNRADAGSLGNLDIGGATWATVNGTWDILSSSARIQGAASVANLAYVTQADQDRYLAAKPTLYDAGLYFRGNGSNGYVFYGDATAYYIKKWTGGGSFTTLATSTGITPSGSPFMAVRCKGGLIKAYVDGVKVCEVTDTTYTGTQWGLFKYGTGTRQFDEFLLRSLAS